MKTNLDYSIKELEAILSAVAYKCADCMGYERLTKHCRDDIFACELDCALLPYRIVALQKAMEPDG